MPNRILREGIITSEPVNSLSWAGEVFYRRLISVVDDFGRYYAKPELLRAACYPLQVDKVGNQDIVKWLAESQKAGLVRAYTIENKEYLEVINFKQQVRAKQSKFPCPSCAKHVLCKCDTSAHLDGDGDGDDKPPSGGDPKDYIWREGLKLAGVTRSFLGKLCKDYSEKDVALAITKTIDHAPADPKPFLVGCLKNQGYDPAKGAK